MSSADAWKLLELNRDLDLVLSTMRYQGAKFAGSFFEAEPRKPPITIVMQDDHPDDIAAAIVSSNSGNRVNADAINFMIYKQLEQIKATLPENWESFGVEIGKKGDIITPLSLLEVNISSGDSNPKAKLPSKTRPCTARLAMYYIFAPMCLDTPHERQRNALAAKMAAAVPVGQKIRSVSHKDVAMLYCAMTNNSTYARMASALDMFMERFPDHAGYKMRVGTECTRYMHSAANFLIPHFSALLGVSGKSEILNWILALDAKRDAEKLFDPLNAVDDPYSYSPYGVSMGLVSKSIAAIKHNTDLHVYVHTVGAILGNERSRKAKMLKDCSTVPVKMAFVVGAIKSVQRQLTTMTESDDAVETDTDADDMIKKSGKCPTSMDYTFWKEYIGHYRGLWIAYMKKGARLALEIKNSQPGTIGAMVVEQAKQALAGVGHYGP